LYDTAAITTTTSTGTNVDNNKGTTRRKASTRSTTTSTSTSINVDNNKATTRSKGKKRKEAVDVAESTALITITKAAKSKTKGEWLYLIFFICFTSFLFFYISLFVLLHFFFFYITFYLLYYNFLQQRRNQRNKLVRATTKVAQTFRQHF